MRLIDLTGRKFGRLTVIERVEDYVSPNGKHEIQWKCVCSCPDKTICIALGGNLRRGLKRSCGCLSRENTSNMFKKHGKRNTRLYKIWCDMKARCYNPNELGYKWYGAEAKNISEGWVHNFQAFYDWAMSNGYRDNLTIERIDGTKGYSPENCKWATMQEQQNNRRNNRKVHYNGELFTIAQLARKYNIPYKKLWRRLNDGWEIQRALETP